MTFILPSFGASVVSAVPGGGAAFNTYSADFDASDDHLHFGSSATNRYISLGSGDFAISMWFYPRSTTQDFLFKGASGRAFITGGTLSFRSWGSSINISSAYSINNWYHLVVEL